MSEIHGTIHNDLIFGTELGEVIHSYEGRDSVSAGSGDDNLSGGHSDTLRVFDGANGVLAAYLVEPPNNVVPTLPDMSGQLRQTELTSIDCSGLDESNILLTWL